MDSLISRQAAIAYAISGRTREFNGEKWIRVSEVRESLQTMPSAQPEPIRLRLDHELSKEEYERLKKDCAEQPIILLPKESAQQWTSWESGELPKESGWYIVTAYDGRTSRTTFAKYQKRLKRWDLTGARAYWRVLVWQPLPKPWEGKEN